MSEPVGTLSDAALVRAAQAATPPASARCSSATARGCTRSR